MSGENMGEMDLGNLPEYWKTIQAEFAAIAGLPAVNANLTLSARAFDEAQPAGLRTYMNVTRYLGVARDNHEALLALLQAHGATLWAPWSLLRPIFETAFLAAWILDPDDGKERRARGLRCEVVDAYEQRRHRAAFKAIPELRHAVEEDERRINQTSMATYREEAAALGWNFERIHQKINIVDELKCLSLVRGNATMASFMEATWRLLSGYEHGLGWASLKGSDMTVQAQVPGGAEVMLVINDSEFVNAAKTSYLLLLTACRLLQRRHSAP